MRALPYASGLTYCCILGEIAEYNGGSRFLYAKEQEERDKLWKARHGAWYAAAMLKPGCEVRYHCTTGPK